MHHHVAFLAFLAATPAVAQWTVSTYAGGAAPLAAPTSAGVGDVTLALDPTASVVVANLSNHVIWRYRAGGVVERIAGTGDPGFSGDGGPATQAQLHAPRDAQMDAAGNVYFWDSLNYRIRRIDTQGSITTVAGTGVPWAAGMDREGPAASRSLSGIGNFTVASSGAFYFTDAVGNQYQIRRVNTSGQLEVFAGVFDPTCGSCLDGDSVPALSAHLKGPRSLTFDRAGNLYVADTFTYTVLRRISPDGVVTRIAGNYEGPQTGGQTFEGQAALSAHLEALSSVVFDLSGNIYFVHNSDFDRGRLIQIRANGTFHILHEAGWSVYLDATGRLLYVFSGSNGITLFSFVDESFLAFIPQSPVTSVEPPDGTPAASVRVTGLVAMSRSGELHFLSTSCRIRKFDRDGLLRTVAGSSCPPSSFVIATSMVFDSQNRLWVLNNFGAISTVSSDGTFMLQRSLSLTPRPPFQQIALDAQDRLYASDGWASTVIRVEADGTVRQIGTGSGNLGNDSAGNVYVTQPGGIYRVLDDGSLSKFLSTSFGCERMSVDTSRGRVWCGLSFADATGTYSLGLRGGYSGDGGPVQSARFENIRGFSRGPDGSIYVTDSGRVRKVTPGGPTATPVISSGGIVNSASYTGGVIAPGELISIFGFNFGPPTGAVEVGQAVNNVLPSAVGRTKVLFGGSAGNIDGKITAVTPNQINVFVPYGVAPGTLVDIVVLVDDTPSGPVRVPVVERAFDLFSMNASGSGQGAIINQNGSLNGPANPAPRGTIISLWGTGEGRTTPLLPDGALVISTPYPKAIAPVTVRIGGVDAEVLYAGAAPTLPTGAFQINARIPLSIPPGNASVSVTVGSSTTTRNITVAVQ